MRSPTIPRSARSLRSLVSTSRPNGILPGAKVFQLPPPAVEASAPFVPVGTAGAGMAAPAEASGAAGEAAATVGGALAAAGGGCAAGAWALGGACCATAGGGGGAPDGAGAGEPFWFLASLPGLGLGPALATAGAAVGLGGATG